MKNQNHAEVCKLFPRIYEYATSSFLKHLPLFKFLPHDTAQNLEARAMEVTFLLVNYCYYNSKVRAKGPEDVEFCVSFKSPIATDLLQLFVAKEVDYEFVDRYVKMYADKLLEQKKILRLPK